MIGEMATGTGMLFGAAGDILGANAGIRAADANNVYLKQSAEFDIMRGRLAQADVDRQASQVLSEQKTSYAAQNIDLSSESVMQVAEETRREAARVKNEVELDAAMSAWGKTEQGRINREQAGANARAARIGATGQIIGGLGVGASGFF